VKWLLDTNVLSETVRERPNQIVTQWLDEQPRAMMAISLVTVAELQHGVLLSEDAKRQREFSTWIDGQVLPSFSDRILPITLDITVHWLALLRALMARRQTRAPADLLLAATAHVHALTLVTRNTRHFALTGITVYNPWTDETQEMEAP
jgi:predicted nucleic acid-binding protein